MDQDEMQGVTHAIRESKLYTITETAKLIGRSRQTVYNLIDAELIKAFKKDGHWSRVFGREIINYFKNGGM